LCFYLCDRRKVCKGQLAHINHRSEDSRFENLVFLCLEHHDEFDSRTSQSKGLSEAEVRTYRDHLYDYVKNAQGTGNSICEENPGGVEEARRYLVAKHLEASESEELKVLTQLALHGRTEVMEVHKLCSNTVPINSLLVAGIVENIPAPPDSPYSQQFYEINQELLDAVNFNLSVRGLLKSH